jgi:hypothetical protein
VSEFSESYHFRSDEPDAVVRRLREARFGGVVFPPRGGWLTFVPYAGGNSMPMTGGASYRLSRAAGVPLLWYFYAQDHGWGFKLLRPGQPEMSFESWWDPASSRVATGLELAAFAPLAGGAPLVAELDRLIGSADQSDGRSAFGFAAALGLPAYRWLSPDYVTSDTGSFLKQGAKKVGRRPGTSAVPIAVPGRQPVDLQWRDPSAAEAFAIIRDHVKGLGPSWIPTGLHALGGGRILDEAGRLAGGGYWGVEYRHVTGRGLVRTALWPAGFVTCLSVENRYGMWVPPGGTLTTLPADWIDSTRVVDIVLQAPVRPPPGPPSSMSMELRHLADQPGWFWIVNRRWIGPRPRGEDTTADFVVEACTGELIGARSGRYRNGQLVEQL